MKVPCEFMPFTFQNAFADDAVQVVADHFLRIHLDREMGVCGVHGENAQVIQIGRNFPQADRAELEGRMLRMAELEDKKAQLAVKRQVMDDVFALAVEKLRRLPEEEKRAFFREQLLSTARGDEELFIGQEENAWFSDAFLADLNAALAAAGKPGCLKKGGSVDGCGFELRQGGEAQRCTFEALVEGSRMALEGDVARVLFQE